jgi:hypothetical protein
MAVQLLWKRQGIIGRLLGVFGKFLIVAESFFLGKTKKNLEKLCQGFCSHDDNGSIHSHGTKNYETKEHRSSGHSPVTNTSSQVSENTGTFELGARSFGNDSTL